MGQVNILDTFRPKKLGLMTSNIQLITILGSAEGGQAVREKGTVRRKSWVQIHVSTKLDLVDMDIEKKSELMADLVQLRSIKSLLPGWMEFDWDGNGHFRS